MNNNAKNYYAMNQQRERKKEDFFSLFYREHYNDLNWWNFFYWNIKRYSTNKGKKTNFVTFKSVAWFKWNLKCFFFFFNLILFKLSIKKKASITFCDNKRLPWVVRYCWTLWIKSIKLKWNRKNKITSFNQLIYCYLSLKRNLFLRVKALFIIQKY